MRNFPIYIIAISSAGYATDGLANQGPAAQPIQIAIGDLSSQLDCTVYQESSGTDTTVSRSRTGIYADPFVTVGVTSNAEASYSTWKTWYVKDCVDHFPSLKLSLQSSLAETNATLKVSNVKADYYLSGALSATSSESGPIIYDNNADISSKSSRMKIYFNFVVRDKRGSVVFGSQVQSSINESFQAVSTGTSIQERADGEGIYSALEQKMSQAVARRVAFYFKPIEVLSFNNEKIILNYGSKMLPIGSSLTAMGRNGDSVKLLVVTATTAQSVAIVDGNRQLSGLINDWTVNYLDPDSPEANGRRLQKVNLP